jgi:hypothetical protein
VLFERNHRDVAGREVFLGFAPANILHSLSFADVLDEDTGRGYQRGSIRRTASISGSTSSRKKLDDPADVQRP